MIQKKNVMILFACIMTAMLGYSIALPVLPFYIEKLGGGGLQLGMLVAVYGIMQLIFAPVWGSLSDQYGRRPILMVGMSGLGLGMVLFAFSKSLLMLYGAQMVSGALACAMFPVAMAYITDSSTEAERAGLMGKVGAAAGLGIIIGPGIGGILAGYSLAAPFWAASAVCFSAVGIIYLVLPESLISKQKKAENMAEKKKIIDFGRLYKAVRTPVGFGLVMAFALYFGKSNFSSIFGLYALERFGYGPKEVGIVLMIMSFVYLVSQGFIVGPLSKKYGEKKVITGALAGNAVGFLFLLLANTFITMVIAVSFFILLNALLKPAALSFISTNAQSQQGEAMGLAESFMSIGRIGGPLWAGMVFDINIFMPFISGAVFFMVMFIYSLRKIRNMQSK